MRGNPTPPNGSDLTDEQIEAAAKWMYEKDALVWFNKGYSLEDFIKKTKQTFKGE